MLFIKFVDIYFDFSYILDAGRRKIAHFKKEEGMLEKGNSMFRGLALFDIDGTLIQTTVNNDGHSKALFYAMDAVCGIKNASLDGIDFEGMTDAQLIVAMFEKYNLMSIFSMEKLFDVFGEMGRFYRKEFANIIYMLLPGVESLLGRLLRNGIICGVVTGAIKEIGVFKLRRAGLYSYFCVKRFGDQALRRTDLVKQALDINNQKKWVQRDRVFLFGDTVRDIEAGKEADVKTISVATGSIEKDKLAAANPDFLLDDLSNTDFILYEIFKI